MLERRQVLRAFYGCLKDTKILKRPQGIKIKNRDSKRCKLGKNEIGWIWGAWQCPKMMLKIFTKNTARRQQKRLF